MEKMQADVVIIAGGTAGLAAAVTAAEGGAKVIVFEKSGTTGGCGNMGMGIFAVESRLQRLRQVGLTREEAFKAFMNYTHWRVDARLVKTYIDKSASTIDWLEKLGVEFFDVSPHSVGFNYTWHIVKPKTGAPTNGVSSVIMKTLTDRAKELGVKIFLKTPAKKILKEGNRITGVIAENEPGQTIQVDTKTAVIATGGFGDNVDWINKYTGYTWGKDLFSFRVPGLVGDGIRMAWEMGGAETEMNMEIVYNLPVGYTLGAVKMAFRQPNLLVNMAGERFANEEIMVNDTFTGNALARQKNRCAFIIFDETTKKYYAEKGLDFPVWFLSDISKTDNFDTEFAQALKQAPPHVFAADSIEELSGKIGIDRDALCKTVSEYNKACETGRDELFAKNSKYLRPIQQPKIYAGRIFPNAFGSLGGIKINYKAEVLTKDFDAIPGLYAAGTDANTIYADSYVFILPGNTMGFAINSGRIAGENALAYINNQNK
jgi:fumarate reductase flavoprotein subunit